ncbi:MAG TPA: PIG-L family deacetylase [Chitinophagaceae bacterium]|nr:PIG-L family deacetylase [Chitinophagaceae bacterium]
MHRKFTLSFLLLLGSLVPYAQEQKTPTSSEILQQIKKLNTTGSVLYIAAHPDDENTRLLGYLANERKLRTGYLSLTRGDGGQNLIGKEQGEMLGLIRTQELLAARRMDGAEQFFTRAYDFGFSKNPEETFTFWNKESVLADVVWVIRNFKPDVIICRFPTTGEGGHGHHTASAILALEAFDAAADPNRFPEQLKSTETWQAKRIFWNTFNFGGLNTTSENQMKIDVGGYNPLLGQSYGEIAADSRSNHKSQGFGSAKTRGEAVEYFKQLKGDTARKDVFEGINQSWTRFGATARFKTQIDQCIAQYNPQAPEKSVPALVALYKQLQQAQYKNTEIQYWRTQKLKELQDIIMACSGLWMETTAPDYTAIPGKAIELNTQIIARNKADVRIKGVRYSSGDTAMNFSARQNQLYTFKRKETLAAEHPFSTPYWLATPHTTGSFVVDKQDLIGRAENGAALYVGIDLEIAGVPFTQQVPVSYKSTDPVKGERYRPLEVLPPATINTTDAVYVFRNTNEKKIRFIVKANKANTKGTLKLQASKGWTVLLENASFDLAAKNDEAIIDAYVSPSENAESGTITASVQIEGNSYGKSIRRIDYDHIPQQFTLADATTKLVKVDVQKSGNNIGYIPGAGDDVPACLQQVGYKVTTLTDDVLSSTDLSRFDAIVTGVRAYNTNDKLQLQYKKLMNYVQQGGNLIVQYNTNNRISTIPQNIGPYPFVITRDRVTDEHAKMDLLQPQHAAFNFPNKISDADFDGWIQERGIYFATDSLNKYDKVLSMKDPGEKPNNGSLLIAPYGNGNFVYTGLAFFRQLPAGVPGAYRLFANLISLPANTKKK